MLHFTSYYAQSLGLPTNGYQRLTLACTDTVTAFREYGRIFFVAGIVSTVASSWLGYSTDACIYFSAGSAIAWITGDAYAPFFEEKAQKILRHVRGVRNQVSFVT